MTLLAEAKREAKEFGVEIGRLKAVKDRLGYYDVYEDGIIISESMVVDNADEAKAEAVDYLIAERAE